MKYLILPFSPHLHSTTKLTSLQTLILALCVLVIKNITKQKLIPLSLLTKPQQLTPTTPDTVQTYCLSVPFDLHWKAPHCPASPKLIGHPALE